MSRRVHAAPSELVDSRQSDDRPSPQEPEQRSKTGKVGRSVEIGQEAFAAEVSCELLPLRMSRSTLAAELRARWEAGQRVSALDLLKGVDVHALSRDELLDLVYEQVLQRYAAGLDPGLESLCHCFPDLAHSFRRMASLHRALHIVRPNAAEPGTWPAPGDVWKHYYLIEELGSGSFARVYLAADTTLAWRPVVLKLSESLAVEAEALARLEHTNIVPVLCAIPSEPPELAALCMPYLGRATLRAVMDRLFAPGGLPRRANAILEAIDAINSDELNAFQDVSSHLMGRGERPDLAEINLRWLATDHRLKIFSYVDGVVHLGAQLASALAAAHARNLCHFDIKPSNILMAPGGLPMLFDFNLASRRGCAMGGTPLYMAPEHVRAMLAGDNSAAVGPAADVYALGVVLYELLTARHPLAAGLRDGHTKLAPETLLRNQQTSLAPICTLNRQVDECVGRLVQKALATDPQQRPTAAELADGLRQALSAPARSTRWLQRHRLLAGACTLCLGLLVAAAAVAWRKLPSPADRAYQRGLVCLKAEDPEAAVAALQDCVKRERNRAVAWFLLARAHERLGDWERAVQCFEAARACADDPWIDACLGTAILRNKGPSATALVHLRDAHRKGLETAGLYNNLGLACRKRYRLDEAQTWLNLAIKRQPNLQAAYLNRALLARCISFRDCTPLPNTAVDDIERAIELGPPSVELYTRAAALHLAVQSEGEPPSPKAIERLTEALRHSQQPKLPYFSFHLIALQPTLPSELVGSAPPWPQRVQPVADPLAHLSLEEQAAQLAQRLSNR